MCLSTNAATIFGRPEVTVGRGKERGRTAKCAVSVFSSAAVGGMNAERFNNFLAQARTNLDPDESVIFVYDGAR